MGDWWTGAVACLRDLFPAYSASPDPASGGATTGRLERNQNKSLSLVSFCLLADQSCLHRRGVDVEQIWSNQKIGGVGLQSGGTSQAGSLRHDKESKLADEQFQARSGQSARA